MFAARNMSSLKYQTCQVLKYNSANYSWSQFHQRKGAEFMQNVDWKLHALEQSAYICAERVDWNSDTNDCCLCTHVQLWEYLNGYGNTRGI